MHIYNIIFECQRYQVFFNKLLWVKWECSLLNVNCYYTALQVDKAVLLKSILCYRSSECKQICVKMLFDWCDNGNYHLFPLEYIKSFISLYTLFTVSLRCESTVKLWAVGKNKNTKKVDWKIFFSRRRELINKPHGTLSSNKQRRI